MTNFTALLELHKPVVRYDAHEVYFADSAAEWTDNPGHVLRRGAQGAVLAEVPETPPAPKLELKFLAPGNYGDGTKADREDLISCLFRNYSEQARRLHREDDYANHVYGRFARGTDERTWLQYWFFYFYNDFELLGDEFPAGLHEGDWEMIQLRLGADDETPDLAVYAKHKKAEAKLWDDVERVDDVRPVVYVARGSHAAYFTSGTHWGEAWFDHADGKGFSPELKLEIAADDDPDFAWMAWEGFWGDTKPNPEHLTHPLDDSSPRGPGGHPYWKDPRVLLKTVENFEQFERAEAPAVVPGALVEPLLPAPPAPEVTVTRSGQGLLRVDYTCEDWPVVLRPVRLLVTLNSPQDPKPPFAYGVPISSTNGTVDVPVTLDAAWSYEVHVSVAGRVEGADAGEPPLTSPATSVELAPA
jgi:hypothetical protein